MLNTFFPSTLTGDLTALVKEGLSIRTVNSQASKKGFLKSIGGGLAPAILNGPLGCGKVVQPLSMHTYYPESGEETINWHTLSLIPEGQNLTFTIDSTPSKVQLAATWIVAASTEKSKLFTGGAFALGSTFTGAFCPIFQTLQV